MINQWGKYECGTCGYPVLRSGSHAVWCNQINSGTVRRDRPLDLDRAVVLYNVHGKSLTATAAEVGVEPETLLRAFRRVGILIR